MHIKLAEHFAGLASENRLPLGRDRDRDRDRQ
jgi:hypothetical protein